MDPNETLKELRDLVVMHETDVLVSDDVDRMVELFEALDGWLSTGSFLPEDWGTKRVGRTIVSSRQDWT